MKTWIAIFGSRVMEDGTPSGSLLRRTTEGLRISRKIHDPYFFLTGGTSNSAIPTEASVMQEILMQNGISEKSLHCDHQSHDTLASVHAIADSTRKGDLIYVCSDTYHVLRITLLLRLLGHRAKPLWIKSGRPNAGTLNWVYMWIRDAIALIYDSALVLGSHVLKRARK